MSNLSLQAVSLRLRALRLALEAVAPWQVRWFYRLLGAALGTRLATDAFSGIWRVHTGQFFPWRHLPTFPLYSTNILLLEWALLGVAALALLGGFAQRAALALALLAMLMGLSQRYSNQNALLFIVLVFANLKFADPNAASEQQLQLPNYSLIRVQLLLVYGFSVLNKWTHSFQAGTVLGEIPAIKWSPPSLWAPLAVGVIGAELLIPLLLCSKFARFGFGLAFIVHASFALALPGLWTFSITMWAMAVLWVPGATAHADAKLVPSRSLSSSTDKLAD